MGGGDDLPNREGTGGVRMATFSHEKFQVEFEKMKKYIYEREIWWFEFYQMHGNGD